MARTEALSRVPQFRRLDRAAQQGEGGGRSQEAGRADRERDQQAVHGQEPAPVSAA
ncbi:hypothetical protein GCM10023238_01390 [Streptomyces heliomycini]